MSRLTDKDWVMAAIAQCAQGGIAKVKVELLAKKLGVSKGSFYWHFKDKSALVAAMLETWKQEGTQAIIARVDNQCLSPQDRLQKLIDVIFDSTPMELAFEIQVRAYAAVDAKAKALVLEVDHQRVAYVQELLRRAQVDRARARAQLIYSILLGDMLQQTYGKANIDRTQLRILRDELLSGR